MLFAIIITIIAGYISCNHRRRYDDDDADDDIEINETKDHILVGASERIKVIFFSSPIILTAMV